MGVLGGGHYGYVKGALRLPDLWGDSRAWKYSDECKIDEICTIGDS